MHGRLHRDILNLIIRLVYDGTPSSLLSVALASRQCYRLAIPYIYQTITVAISSRRKDISKALITRLCQPDTTLHRFIRDIYVIHGHEDTDNLLQTLAEYLPKVQRLRAFYWDRSYAIPEPILNILHRNWPECHLRVSCWDSYFNGTRGNSLAASLCLHDLGVTLPAESKSHLSLRIKLFEILKTCPNLRMLSVCTEGGASIMDDPNDLRNLNVTAEDTLPRLTNMSLLDGIFSLKDLQAWGQKGGWSRLEVLTICNSHLLGGFHGCEKTLKSFKLYCDLHQRTGDVMAVLEHFLASLENLEELDLEGIAAKFPLHALEHYGLSLRSIGIHAYEPHFTRRPDIPITNLLTLKQLCPALTDLAVDVNFQKDWPYDFLETLARFPNLRTLTLYAESKLADGAPDHAVLDKVVAERLFRYIRIHKRGRSLESLTIHRGAQPPESREFHVPSIISKAIFRCSLVMVDGRENIAVQQEGGTDGKEALSKMWLAQDLQQSIQDEVEAREYWEGMPPNMFDSYAYFFRQVLVRQGKKTEGIYDLDYDVHVNEVELVQYEAENRHDYDEEEFWPRSTSEDWASLDLDDIGYYTRPIEKELARRRRSGWAIPVPKQAEEPGSEGFLYDRM